MTMEIAISGQPRLERVFQALSSALDTTTILDQGAALLLAKIRERYLQQRDPDGVTWPESMAAQERRRKGIDGGTLFDTGRLFHSIQLFSSEVNSRSIGTDVPYAPYAQWGKETRIFLGFGEEDKYLVTEFIVKRISEAINGIG